MRREATFRQRAVNALDPAPGERLLELGCGHGNSFPALRSGVGDAVRPPVEPGAFAGEE